MNKSDIQILVIDDDATMLEIASWTLVNLGYSNVQIASDGDAGLGKMLTAESPFDIIICDLNMPLMNGVQFTRNAIEGNFTGGIVLLSGEEERMLSIASELINRSQATLLGALAKPLDSVTLADLLEKYCQLPLSSHKAGTQLPIKKWELEQGIQDGESLVLAYQPVIDMDSGKITGVEALARWKQPERGLLNADAFIPLARENDLIVPLSEKIYELGIIQIAAWKEAGLSIDVSLNLAIQAFSKQEFRNLLVDMATAAAIDPSNITFEFNQSDIDTSDRVIIESLMGLRLEGFKLVIDNFRPDVHAIKLLQNAPFTGMKVNMDVLAAQVRSDAAQSSLSRCIKLARNLGVRIGAKHVIDREDVNLLEANTCDYAQGNYYSPPVPANRVQSLTEEWVSDNAWARKLA